jgi:hypothetical protein
MVVTGLGKDMYVVLPTFKHQVSAVANDLYDLINEGPIKP